MEKDLSISIHKRLEKVSQAHALIELARRHPCAYSAFVSRVGLDKYDPSKFHWDIGDAIVGAVMGTGPKRIIINMPPRHGKSELASIRFPAWFLSKVPNESIILNSHSANLAVQFGKKARNLINNNRHKMIFGKMAALDLKGGRAAGSWALTNGSEYFATGIRAGSTGRGGHVFIDDPLRNREDAKSARVRELIKDWFTDVALTRLKPEGAIVIIMTRWHYDDLCGWLSREFPEEWTVFSYPAIKDDEPNLYDSRKPGEALWPEKFTIDHLSKKREEVGSISFEGMYQQRPSLTEGDYIKTDWFYRFKEPYNEYDKIVWSWDTAFETNRASDYTVGIKFGVKKHNKHVLHVLRGKWSFPDLKRRMIELCGNAEAVLIEKRASGHDLLHSLQEETGLPIIGIVPHNEKGDRFASVTGQVEAGRVWVPEEAPWLPIFFRELTEFPNGEHDDIVDALSQGLRWIGKYLGAGAIAS